MKDMSVAAAAASQQVWSAEQPAGTEEAVQAPGEIGTMLEQGQEESRTLAEMIKDAQERADAHREALKQMPKGNTRYGDAPLEAYARLARAKTAAQVNAASGFARRRIAQLRTSLHVDSENAARIKSAIRQLEKAVSRGEKKKRELSREQLVKLRKARSKEDARRRELELRRRQTGRMIREKGYLREAEISDRLATQLTQTQMELRSQAQNLTAASAVSPESAARQYAAEAAAGAGGDTAAPEAAISVQG